ncbi:MAG: hypothetical protein HDR28_00700 [Lachnospiraceae bacterium]|nr:hypothetical protein [Lachnospiraceae bacterium]
MNSWIILLFLLFWNQNGRNGIGDSGCGCEPVEPPCRPREREREGERDCDRDCGRDRDRGRERDADRDSCPCNNDSRFEPRFDSRPFGNSGCGCDDN